MTPPVAAVSRPSATGPGPILGVVGGTGPQGRGLAARWTQAGYRVLLGSRDPARAVAAADELVQSLGQDAAVTGHSNVDAAAASEIVLIAVPYAGQRELLAQLAPHLAGKVVISCVNPLGFDKQGPYALAVPEGSAAQQAAALLPGARVVAAFHHLSAVRLEDLTTAEVDSDVLVLGDDADAVDQAMALADAVPGLRGLYAGTLRMATQVEALTGNLIAINKRYKTHAGIRVTDA